MKFCPKCDDRMNGEFCTTCDKDKLPERIKFSDYSNQKLNSCDKGCGAKIYFDEDFKTDEGKFIPIDRNTCLLYTSPSPRDLSTSRMPSSA